MYTILEQMPNLIALIIIRDKGLTLVELQWLILRLGNIEVHIDIYI